MDNPNFNPNMNLSEHFTLGELCKTSYITADGNIPSQMAIDNLRRLCADWLEEVRYLYSMLYGDGDVPLIISSGYRSAEVNRMCGGAKGSNHLTGCAVDIRCQGPEQMSRLAVILLDLADSTKRDFDELILEKRGTTYWVHFAVRPKDRSAMKGDACQSKNRRKFLFDCR